MVIIQSVHNDKLLRYELLFLSSSLLISYVVNACSAFSFKIIEVGVISKVVFYKKEEMVIKAKKETWTLYT